MPLSNHLSVYIHSLSFAKCGPTTANKASWDPGLELQPHWKWLWVPWTLALHYMQEIVIVCIQSLLFLCKINSSWVGKRCWSGGKTDGGLERKCFNMRRLEFWELTLGVFDTCLHKTQTHIWSLFWPFFFFWFLLRLEHSFSHSCTYSHSILAGRSLSMCPFQLVFLSTHLIWLASQFSCVSFFIL